MFKIFSPLFWLEEKFEKSEDSSEKLDILSKIFNKINDPNYKDFYKMDILLDFLRKIDANAPQPSFGNLLNIHILRKLRNVHDDKIIIIIKFITPELYDYYSESIKPLFFDQTNRLKKQIKRYLMVHYSQFLSVNSPIELYKFYANYCEIDRHQIELSTKYKILLGVGVPLSIGLTALMYKLYKDNSK